MPANVGFEIACCELACRDCCGCVAYVRVRAAALEVGMGVRSMAGGTRSWALREGATAALWLWSAVKADGDGERSCS